MTVIRLKNSSVKDKTPDPTALVFGEVCVNTHQESPAIHFKDQAGAIRSLTPATSANDGAIKIVGENGVTATGADASANQAGDSLKTLSVDQAWLNTHITANFPGAGAAPGDGAININAGDGLEAAGDNASANQTGDTTRTLSLDTDWLLTWLGTNHPTPTVGDGDIEVAGGDGIDATGDNAKANQSTKTTRTLAVDSTVIRTTGDQSMADTKTFTGTIGLASASVIQLESLDSLPD